MYRALPPHSDARSAFHQPAAIDPGGQELTPLLMVAQNTVQPEPQLLPGPHTDAYADCGLRTNPTLSTARALPTTPARTRKPRRDVRRASQPVTASAARCATEPSDVRPKACRASAVAVTSALPRSGLAAGAPRWPRRVPVGRDCRAPRAARTDGRPRRRTTARRCCPRACAAARRG